MENNFTHRYFVELLMKSFKSCPTFELVSATGDTCCRYLLLI